jgi:CRP-like cAMP-binding protein
MTWRATHAGLYVVVEGSLNVYCLGEDGKDAIKGKLSPGDTFGEVGPDLTG